MHGKELHQLVAEIMVVLAAGLFSGVVCRRLNVSLLVGYLVVGALIGNGALGLISDSEHNLEVLAEAGVLFLLFSVGIEFSVDQLQKIGHTMLLGGTTQMLLVALPLMLICRLFGLSWPAAALSGFAGALSSTILVFKALSEVGQATAQHGRLAIGILLFQDIALIPLLLLVPLLTGKGPTPDAMTYALLAVKSLLFVGCVWGVRQLLSRFIIVPLVQLRSVELVALFAVCLLGFTGLGAEVFGLPPAIGALAAGLMLSGQRLSQQADSVLLPFREMFSVVFFVTLGMLLRPFEFFAEPLLLLCGFAAMIALKTGAATVALRFTGLDWQSAFGMGLGMSQLGEFAFLLVAKGVAEGLIDRVNYNRMLFIAMCSLLATPVLLRRGLKFVAAEWNEATATVEVHRPPDSRPLALVIGLGPIGQRVVQWLTATNFQVNLIDLSPVNLYRFAQEGHSTFSGDAADLRILKLADVEHAALAVVTVPRDDIALQIIASLKQVRPDLNIFARCRFEASVTAFEAAGATAVVSEEIEAGHRLTEICERSIRMD
uniref:Sodium:proton exchanger n=1 Tax=Schlesneria paludicola TaxID=360056 RepID=A0A7C2P3V0_9PLAN